MTIQGTCFVLFLWLFQGAGKESTSEICEDCKMENNQLIQTQEVLRKEWKEEEAGQSNNHGATAQQEENDGEKKELVIGSNGFRRGKQGSPMGDIYKCVENRERWYCPEDSGNPQNRLNDQNENYRDEFKIFWDTSKNMICAERIDGGGKGWGMDLKIACQTNSKMETITFGSGQYKNCVIKWETSEYICESDAGDKHKRLKEVDYDDKFDITVTRKLPDSDSRGVRSSIPVSEICAEREGGWGLDLRIKCAKDAEVIRPLSNLELCVTVAGGKLMTEQELVFEKCTRTLNQLFMYWESTEQIKLFQNPGLCINLWEGEDGMGTRLRTWNCEEGNSDKWLLQESKIISKKNPTLCVGIDSFALTLANCSESKTNILLGKRAFTPTHGAALFRPLQDMELCVEPSVDVFLASRIVQKDITLQKCKESAAKLNQVFHTPATGHIKLFGAPEVCLRIWGGKMEANALVKTWKCEGDDADKWFFEDNQIKVKANQKLCLGVDKFQQDEKLKLVNCDLKLNAFQVSGEEKMDCPWKTTTTSKFSLCGDRSHHFACAHSGHGRTIQCTTGLQMCKDMQSSRDFACMPSCGNNGGERPC